MYIPSYDFKLFKIPNFSPLEANEYGAMTQFSANTPLGYVDYSINQLAGLLQPDNAYPYAQRQFPSRIIPYELQQFFQGKTETIGSLTERLKKVRDSAQEELDKLGQGGITQSNQSITSKTCPEGYKPVNIFGIFSYCGKGLKSDGEGGPMGQEKAPPGMQSVENFLNALPQGSGIFLIAIIVIILLLLFVRK